MAIIEILKVQKGKQVTYTTTPPGDGVTVYRGDLFTQVANQPAVLVSSFSPSKLESDGAVITVNPTADGQMFIFVITATTKAATTMDVKVVTPKSTFTSPVSLPPNMSTAEWVMVPR